MALLREGCTMAESLKQSLPAPLGELRGEPLFRKDLGKVANFLKRVLFKRFPRAHIEGFCAV